MNRGDKKTIKIHITHIYKYTIRYLFYSNIFSSVRRLRTMNNARILKIYIEPTKYLRFYHHM